MWVLDGPLGHLAIPHRGGYFEQLYGWRSVHFDHPRDALSWLERQGPPVAILVGYADEGAVSELLRDCRLAAVPTLLSDWRIDWSELPERPSIHRASHGMTTIEALHTFASGLVSATRARPRGVEGR